MLVGVCDNTAAAAATTTTTTTTTTTATTPSLVGGVLVCGVHVFPAYLHSHTVANSRQQKDWEKANANKITKKVVEAAEDPKEASGEKVEADADADAAEQTAEEGQV